MFCLLLFSIKHFLSSKIYFTSAVIHSRIFVGFYQTCMPVVSISDWNQISALDKSQNLSKLVNFLFILLCYFCFCQQTVREWESAELYDYKDSSNNKKWILKIGIGLFSFIHICNSVCHVNLESELSN